MRPDKVDGEMRQETLYFELPYDAGLPNNFTLHTKDEVDAEREAEWTEFDLQAWLGLDSPPVAGSMESTTLTFRSATVPIEPLRLVREAWPSLFAQAIADQGIRARIRHSPPIQAVRDLLRKWRGAPQLESHHTVVQATRIARAPVPSTEAWRFSQLEIALQQLNGFLVATGSVHGSPEISAVSPEELQPVMIGWGCDIPEDGSAPDHVDYWSYLVHERLAGAPVSTLSKPEADYATWLFSARDHPLLRAGQFLQEAVQSAHRGRLTHAAVEIGTGSEMLISAALQVSAEAWGWDEQRLEGILSAPFASRVKDHLAPRLGYDRDLANSSDPLGAWWQGCYLLRNRVVHLGHRPSREEVEAAVRAGQEFHADLGQRLSADPEIRKNLLPIPDEAAKAAQDARERRDAGF